MDFNLIVIGLFMTTVTFEMSFDVTVGLLPLVFAES